jgi:hypothetical protein
MGINSGRFIVFAAGFGILYTHASILEDKENTRGKCIVISHTPLIVQKQRFSHPARPYLLLIRHDEVLTSSCPVLTLSRKREGWGEAGKSNGMPFASVAAQAC